MNITDIENTLKKIIAEDESKFQPYKSLGDGLYILSNGAITNEKGLELYLKQWRNKID